MLSHHALRHVYGGLTGDPRVGFRRCLSLSAHFTGEPIKVTFVQFSGSREAHASASYYCGVSETWMNLRNFTGVPFSVAGR